VTIVTFLLEVSMICSACLLVECGVGEDSHSGGFG
jgi:hypothetical protein